MNDKPFDLVVDEIRIKLQNVLDESGLPITVIAMILREMSSFMNQREIAHIRELHRQEMEKNEKSRAD